jgi:hypothetical protein
VINGSPKSTTNSNVSLGKWWSGAGKKVSELPPDENWFDVEAVRTYEEFADTSSTAQVYPVHFTSTMAKLAEQSGARVILGMVQQINCSDVDSDADPARLTSLDDATHKMGSLSNLHRQGHFCKANYSSHKDCTCCRPLDAYPYAASSDVPCPRPQRDPEA